MRKWFVLVVIIVIGIGVYMWFSNDESTEIVDENASTENNHINENNRDENTPEVTESPQDPIEEQLEQMSIDEKIGQLFIGGIEGTGLTAGSAALIKENHLGGVILFGENLETPAQSLQLVNDLKDIQSDEDVPLFISVDEEGGQVERLPGLTPLQSAAEIGNYDENYAYDNGVLLAKLVSSFGMNLNFAPVLDVNSNPDNPVIGERAFSGNPDVVSELGVQLMKGMQDEGVITAVKHFPGHGDTKEDSHEQLPVVDKTQSELEKTEFIPFKAAADEDADMVLMAHIVLPEIGVEKPASISEAAVDILRNDLGYDGVIITDDLTMGAVMDNYPMEEVTVDAVKAGIDILMIAHEKELLEKGVNSLEEAVENGDIAEERIDESVRAILTLKDKYQVDNQLLDDIEIEELNEAIEKVYDRK